MSKEKQTKLEQFGFPKSCKHEKVKYLCGGCKQLHDDTDFDPTVDKIWENITEEEFLTWLYTNIGDENVDCMFEISLRIATLKGKEIAEKHRHD